MIITYSNKSYRISYDGVSMVENALGNPNLIQISVIQGCTIHVAPNSYGITYLPNGDYKSWTITGLNTSLARKEEHHIYARLRREDTDALLLFSVNDYAIDGKIVGVEASEASEDYYYIKLGKITDTDATTGASRKREITYDGGYLNTPQGNEEGDPDWRKLFGLTADNLINALKHFASFTVQGTLSIVGKIMMNGKELSGVQRNADEEELTNDETVPTTKYLHFKFLDSIAKKFIRKDRDDQTPFVLSMLAGARFGNFVPGIIGAIIDQFGDAEMGGLVLRKFLSVPELRYNRVTVYKGKQIISPGGGCLVESFTTNGDGSWTIVSKLEEGEPLSQFVDDILLAYWHDKDETTGDFKGFREMKFRVTSVDYNAKTFVVVPKPDSLSVPSIAMTLAHVGNITNEDRQTYIMIDSTQGNNNITFFDNCNTWDIEPHQEMSWFGKKKGRMVAGIDVSDYSAVLKNVIMTGLIFQIDEISGDMMRVPCDKEEYVAGKRYAYYDRVSHIGALWLCVNDKGTDTTPEDGNANWLKQVSEGAPGKPGEPGSSIKMLGHWNSSMRPVPANCMVSYYNGVYLSLRETNQAPISTLMYANGSYFTNETGGYMLAADEVNEDWEMILENGKNGVSILFQGSFPSAPADPKDGWSYYNTTDCRSYVYQDGKWYVTAIDGKDGKDFEWIYTRTTTGTKPESVDSKQQDDYVPDGWTDDQMGCTPELPFEWTCKRVKRDGLWGAYSESSICNRYAFSTTSQWSTNNADWHDIFATGDIYIRYSSDGGKTWTDGARAIGESGKDGPYTNFEFAIGESNIQAPMNGWQDAPPEGEKGKYIWMRTQYIVPPATVNPSAWAYSCLTGTDGIGILSSDVLYYLSTSPTSLAGGEWQTTAPTWSSGKYMWTKTKIVYTNETTKETEPACITGSTGIGVRSIVEEYYLSSSATSLTGGSWVQTSPAWKQGYYVWTHSVITYTDNTTSTTSDVCVSGGIGETGGTGPAGVIPSGHWQSANVPYKKTSLVTFYNASFLALVDTSNPPMWLLKWGPGNTDYLTNSSGGYTPLGGVENNLNTEWLMLTPPPVNGSDGTSILFQGRFPSPPDNPKDGWSYYNTLDFRSYVYQTGKWYIMNEDGKDGTDFEWIYTRTGTNTKPVVVESIQQNDYVPPGWTDDPLGCTAALPFEWACKREKDFGIWSPYSEASIFNMYAFSTTSQWSTNNADWHNAFTAGDIYIRYSSDGGKTWTDGARAIGESGKDGPYTHFEFAVGESETQAPMYGWKDAPSVVPAGQYLWMRTQFVIPPAAAMPDAWSYSRITGSTGGTGPAGVIPSGHWQSANVPYKKTSLVTFYNASFLALVDTSNPPMWLLKWGPGATDYLINSTGGYTPLSGVENNLNTEWLMLTPPPVNGTDGDNGNDSTSYSLTSPIATFNISSVGSLSPSSVLISCKKKKGEGAVTSCSDFYLAARKYNGSWLAHVAATKSSSLSLPGIAGYTQFSVRAYNSASEADAWGSGFVSEIGVGVVIDGSAGKDGPAGSFPRDRGVYVSGESYVWSPSYRDKILYDFGGVYYNFLVGNFGATVTAAPTSANGDGLWEAMGKYKSIATDTLFADGANVAGFMFKDSVLRSQDQTGLIPNIVLNGKTGYARFANVELSGKIEAEDDSRIAGMKVIGNSLRGVQAVMGTYKRQITGDGSIADRDIIVNNILQQQTYIFSITSASQDIQVRLPSHRDMIQKGISEYQFEITVILDKSSLGSAILFRCNDDALVVHGLRSWDSYGLGTGGVLKLFYFQNRYYLISNSEAQTSPW